MKKAIFAGLLLALAGAAIAQVDAARTVATVNGTEIKGSEYYRRMEFLPGVGRNMGDGFAEFPPGFLTLEQLITEKLIFQLAKDKGVYPSDTEVQAELDYRKSKNPKYGDEWLAGGRTQQELMYEVRFDLAQFKLLTAGIVITDQQVDAFYKDTANQNMFTLPKQVTLRVIVVRTQADADTVDKDLAAGKQFADVAKAHSVDVTSSQGGDYGTVPLTMMSADVAKSLNALQAGQATEWFASKSIDPVTNQAAKFKFLLVKVTPASVQPLTADLRHQIRQQMMMDQGKFKNHIKADLDAMRAKATIDIKEKAFADAYKKFIDAYLKVGGG